MDNINCYWLDKITESVNTLSAITESCINYGSARKADLLEIENELRVINIYLTAIGFNEQSAE